MDTVFKVKTMVYDKSLNFVYLELGRNRLHVGAIFISRWKRKAVAPIYWLDLVDSVDNV